MHKIKKTPYYSYCIGRLPKGCRLCVKGRKTVLFITGLCSLRCFYCPISDQKKNRDVVYYNEQPSKNINKLFEEIKLCQSKGVGITGGDPLMKLQRTCNYIKKLKRGFGKKFHIHLYTPLNLVTEKSLKKLHEAGLDEIRFHADIFNKKLWSKLNIARNFKWNVGVEIPVIPNAKKETIKLIDYLNRKIDFLNLNELEISDTNANKILQRGFRAKDKYSYGVLGSEELAKELLKYIAGNNYNFSVHYCTAKLKDKVQLAKRIKLRARNAAEPYDYVDEEGMLIRGAIYCKDFNEIKKITEYLINIYKIPCKYIEVDKKRKRLLTSVAIVYELKEGLKKELKKLNAKLAIVKEYPTYDCFNVETVFI